MTGRCLVQASFNKSEYSTADLLQILHHKVEVAIGTANPVNVIRLHLEPLNLQTGR